MIVVIDIDGILTRETEGWGDAIYMARTPNIENIHRVRQLVANGHDVHLFSARHFEDERVTREWLAKHEVPFTKLILGKIHYDVIVDDRALCHVEHQFLDYDFHHSCWRFNNGHPPSADEVHPCFFCGQGVQIGTKECASCGIMVCPACGNCLCTVPVLTRQTLFRIHAKYCCNLPAFNGVIDLEGFIDNDVVRRCTKALQVCHNICFGG